MDDIIKLTHNDIKRLNEIWGITFDDVTFSNKETEDYGFHIVDVYDRFDTDLPMPENNNATKYETPENPINVADEEHNIQGLQHIFESEENTLNKVKLFICNYLKHTGAPISSIDLYELAIAMYPQLQYIQKYKFQAILADKKTFMPIGRKSLYQLASSTQFNGSVTKCIDNLLQKSLEPIKLEDLINQVLEFRPDSNEKSVRSIIANKIKNHELVVFDGKLIGLISKIGEYATEYKVDNTFSRMTFDERLAAIYDFIKGHNRLPQLNDSVFERSLYVWYMRVKKSTNLPNEQIVLLYQLDNYIKENYMPTNAYDINFIENCNSIKRFVLHRGCLPSRLEDEKLSMWLYRIKINQDSLSDLCKWYLHNLDNYLSAFGLSIL